jgi:hypothetical protein
VNVDGSGIGFFDCDGAPVLGKLPESASEDEEFIHAAKQAESSAFVAHVRQAGAGDRTVLNTHHFAMRGHIMAHNGGFGELARLDAQLGSYASLVLIARRIWGCPIAALGALRSSRLPSRCPNRLLNHAIPGTP